MAARRGTATKTLTPEQARAELRAMGVTVAEFARVNGLSRDAVNDALRGVGKGNFGKSHEAAVALGIKCSPDSCTVPLKSTQTPARRSTTGKAKPAAGTKKARKATAR